MGKIKDLMIDKMNDEREQIPAIQVGDKIIYSQGSMPDEPEPSLFPGDRCVIVDQTGISKLFSIGTFVTIQTIKEDGVNCAVSDDSGQWDTIPIVDLELIDDTIKEVIHRLIAMDRFMKDIKRQLDRLESKAKW